MAESKISNAYIKTNIYTFSNLKQYTKASYYLTIPNYRSTAGIPADAIIVSATPVGWQSLGLNAFTVVVGETSMYIVFQNNLTIENNSYITVRFAYI